MTEMRGKGKDDGEEGFRLTSWKRFFLKKLSVPEKAKKSQGVMKENRTK